MEIIEYAVRQTGGWQDFLEKEKSLRINRNENHSLIIESIGFGPNGYHAVSVEHKLVSRVDSTLLANNEIGFEIIPAGNGFNFSPFYHRTLVRNVDLYRTDDRGTALCPADERLLAETKQAAGALNEGLRSLGFFALPVISS